MAMIRKQDALDYHSIGRKGKIEVISSKPCATQRDLSLAYTSPVSDHLVTSATELELWLADMQQQLERRTKRTREATVADHEELLRCFREESPAAAERLMRRHLAGWEQYLSAPM